MARFNAGWEDYRAKVIPGNAGAVQVSESKLAFYAGAMHLFTHLMTIADAPGNPTQYDIDTTKLEAIYQEIVAFSKTQGEPGHNRVTCVGCGGLRCPSGRCLYGKQGGA